MNDTDVSAVGTAPAFLLFLLFLGLKLAGIISWSWWWITAPLWVPLLVVLIAGIVIFWYKLKD